MENVNFLILKENKLISKICLYLLEIDKETNAQAYFKSQNQIKSDSNRIS